METLKSTLTSIFSDTNSRFRVVFHQMYLLFFLLILLMGCQTPYTGPFDGAWIEDVYADEEGREVVAINDGFDRTYFIKETVTITEIVEVIVEQVVVETEVVEIEKIVEKIVEIEKIVEQVEVVPVDIDALVALVIDALPEGVTQQSYSHAEVVKTVQTLFNPPIVPGTETDFFEYVYPGGIFGWALEVNVLIVFPKAPGEAPVFRSLHYVLTSGDFVSVDYFPETHTFRIYYQSDSDEEPTLKQIGVE